MKKIIILRNGNKYGHVVFDNINETAKGKLIKEVEKTYPGWPIEDQSDCPPVVTAKTDANFKRALQKKKEKKI